MLHDTHVHLDLLLHQLGLLPDRRQIEEGLSAALSLPAQNELKKLLKNHQFAVQSTVDNKNAASCFSLFSQLPEVKILLGAHPEIVHNGFNVETFVEEQNQFISRVYSEFGKKIVGFGECGLDYYYTKDATIIELQKKLFHTQIEQALKHNLPLVIHCRDAFTDLFTILDQYPAIFGHFLVHCFTGNETDLQEIVKRNGLVGIGGICTFKNTTLLQHAVKLCPSSCFVFETDLPFLAPPPHRGNICLPEYVADIAIHIASIRNESVEQVWNYSYQNAIQLFKLTV